MNNSRFKFRVWYNGDYSLSAFCQIDMNGNVWLADTDGANECDFINITDECTVEIATGLKDKNGNLIYEGDICRVKLDNGSYENVLVVWDGAAWRFQSGPWVKLICFWNAEEIEIIGNVHTEEQKQTKVKETL